MAFAVVLALVGVAGGGCARRALEADRPYTPGTAHVESLSVQTMEQGPEQARLLLRGYLPDACTEIERIVDERFGSRIEITVETRRPSGGMCAQKIEPFERPYVIDFLRLRDGVYTATANGASVDFEVYTEEHDGAIFRALKPVP